MSFVTCKLTGRLGNNVFQIMTTIAHALKNNAEYKIPSYTKSKYTTKTPFDFFPLHTNELICYEHYQDGWTYEPIPFVPDMRISGWYQNYRYFDFAKKEIIKAFNLSEKKEDAVCVHIRKGDYRRYPTKHPILPDSYYTEALKSFKGKEIHVFSDEDTELPAQKYFINGDPLADWIRMTQYKNYIIANSTYSWTAAYLSGSEKVIAPSVWYGEGNKHIFTGELIPEQWQKI